MQSLRLNPILNTDSYKLTHWWQYPPDTRHIYSYVESRGGMFDETMLAMLQYIIKSNFAGKVFTLDDVEEARRIAHAHFQGHPKSFNYEGFKSLYAKHEGRLPLRIRAVKEGTVVKSQNALITIENTDPEFYWLTNWAETVLLQVWYPITVATLSRAIKQVIGKALVRTGDPSLLPFKLHDFGFRGVSSKESAAIGGAAHLLNFFGSDTLAAIQLLNQYYSADLTCENPWIARATASRPRNIPPLPRGVKSTSSRPTPIFWKIAPKDWWPASAIPTTSTTRYAICGAARCARKSCIARAP